MKRLILNAVANGYVIYAADSNGMWKDDDTRVFEDLSGALEFIHKTFTEKRLEAQIVPLINNLAESDE